MEKIAFISGGIFIYWSSIILALAALAAITIFAAVYLAKSDDLVGASVTIPLAMVASIVLSRLIHWYCRSDAYESMGAALTDYTKGGYALMGVFIACLAVAALLRLFRVVKNLRQMYDSMAIGAGAGIAVGRLASLFNASDRGMALSENVGFPFAFPVTNTVSGVVENRLATFMIQSGVVTVVLVLLVLYMVISKVAKREIPEGDVALIFLLAYGASQIVCDSTRYDSLFLRSNGFISVVQILGLVAMVVPIVVFSVRAVKNMGIKKIHFVFWVLILGMMGLAGYMEYYVQRHGNEAAFAYSLMSGALICVVLVALTIRTMGNIAKSKKTVNIQAEKLVETVNGTATDKTKEKEDSKKELPKEPKVEQKAQPKEVREEPRIAFPVAFPEAPSEVPQEELPKKLPVAFPKASAEEIPEKLPKKLPVAFPKENVEES